jgi:30S ribosomal protein S31
MGRGDKKTAKGKRFTGSHGNARPQTVKKPTAAKAATVKAPVAAKAPAKKAPAKKAAAAK